MNTVPFLLQAFLLAVLKAWALTYTKEGFKMLDLSYKPEKNNNSLRQFLQPI